MISLKQIFNIDPSKLPNCSPSWSKAYEYAKLMEQGVEFPPVNIFIDTKGTLNYNDGRHRVMASKLCNKPLLVKMTRKDMNEKDITTL